MVKRLALEPDLWGFTSSSVAVGKFVGFSEPHVKKWDVMRIIVPALWSGCED